jgi:hypothetical protein
VSNVGRLMDSRRRFLPARTSSGDEGVGGDRVDPPGGDSIDDVAVLRAGATGSLFDATGSPSTVGSWLRAHTWSNIQQLDAISCELLARLLGLLQRHTR